ncbi:hypothetical protein GCM10010094_63850 [Streptomyces flaveus]|uniref:Uncharacterized protein n=1 Tax=Streptomyces flaveus TaxID=66370 RepID=A0A917VLW3_9ACTN|nr:hypothetical protein GCM10010094_63850 [Streptomyces flaveus]
MDEAIDYHTVDIAEAVEDIDVVLDPVSLDTAARARTRAVLRPGGTFVSIPSRPRRPRRRTRHASVSDGRRPLRSGRHYRPAAEKLPGGVATVLGQVDGVLNVAGIVQRFAHVQDLSLEEIERSWPSR